MKKVLLFAVIAVFMFISCTEKDDMKNILIEESRLPYNAIDFDNLSYEDFIPAMEEAYRQAKTAVDQITNCNEAPTFENTIEPIEEGCCLLKKVMNIFYLLYEVDYNDVLRESRDKVCDIYNESRTYIHMNDLLFSRIKTIYDAKETLGLTNEQISLLNQIYIEFVNGGSLLEDSDRARFIEIGKRLSELTGSFTNNLMDECNSDLLIVSDYSRLEGIPQYMIDDAAKCAQENGLDGWAFSIKSDCRIPFLQNCKDRDLREQMYLTYNSLCNNDNQFDNKEIIKELLALRHEQAKMLGYDTYADYKFISRMADSPQTVYDMLMEIWQYALPQAEHERDELQAVIDAEGGDFKLAAWDWLYYAEKLRKRKYDYDESEVRKYLSLDNVRNGAFMVAEALFGIEIRKVDYLPVYNPAVDTWECLDSDGSHMGYLYTDYYVRDSKMAGGFMACMTIEYNFNGQSEYPNVVNVLNFTLPSDSQPCLLSPDDAKSVFHEFGHALHALLSKCKYPSVSGVEVPVDYVEMCSQIMENWAVDPEILKKYAYHYETGEPIPDDLIDKMHNAAYFNMGYETVGLVSASLLDLEYHMQSDYSDLNLRRFEDAVREKLGMIPEVNFYYQTTFFTHIFESDMYAAGYYSYLWSEMLEKDAFQCFKEEGLLNSETGERFRKNLLEKGSSDDLMKLYRLFRGRDPEIESLLRNRGFID